MTLTDILYGAGALLVSFGGGALIVGALSKWLGELWAQRILDRERENTYRDRELLIRRRDVYRRLATSMRVFIEASTPASEGSKRAFLEAYDEAALWSNEPVICEVGKLLDMLIAKAAGKPVGADAVKDAYAHCVTVMQKDCGFSGTEYQHRVVSFGP